MATIEIKIDFKRQLSHTDLVIVFEKVFSAQLGDFIVVCINLNSCAFLYADFLTVVVAVILHLKKQAIHYKIDLDCDFEDDKIKYAARINFFRLLGIHYNESFVRKSGSGRFVEITPYDENNFKVTNDNISRVVIANASVTLKVQQMLDYCLSEIMDNVLNHSSYPAVYKGKGLCCAQLFPATNEIRLIICDTGVGIHKALSSSPNSKYRSVSEEEALALCIQNGVTNGEGLGFGLFASSEFIKKNGGEMIIYSGNYYCVVKEGKATVSKGAFWQGTFVFMKINTDHSVDYKQIMPEGHTLPDDYQFLLEQRFGIDDNLW